ncbi:MAG TPA: competence protein CoiA family protein [Pyrinomonadaceae bacterium]|nr:competence protein CoiA family protein [Pyrinomonadaceae bacterium]
MLTAAKEDGGQKVAAWEVERADGPFRCFCCRQIVRLRKGEIKAPHFAHVPPVTCEYGTGESEAHRRCKIALFENLSVDARVRKCEMERNLGTVRPDVSAYINEVPVAIEVQLSNLPLQRIQFRTAEYARKGIYVLWLPLYSSELKEELYSLRPWEAWLHAAYFGRVYYWLDGLRVRPVHFRDYYRRRRGRTRDYEQLARRKVPIDGQEALLCDDFRPVNRAAWSGRHISIPPAKLFMDTQPDWYLK